MMTPIVFTEPGDVPGPAGDALLVLDCAIVRPPFLQNQSEGQVEEKGCISPKFSDSSLLEGHPSNGFDR
jgi:hypothetical protein